MNLLVEQEANPKVRLPEYSSSGLSLHTLDFPRLDRVTYLLYVASKLPGSRIDRSTVESLAEAFYQDTTHGLLRPMAEVLADISLPSERRLALSKDPVLNHLSLSYRLEEMEEKYNALPIGLDNTPTGHLDSRAGWDYSRPLLLELDLLSSANMVSDFKDHAKGGLTTFQVTSDGLRHTDALGSMFRYRKSLFDRHDVLISVGRFDQEVFGRLTPKPSKPTLVQTVISAIRLGFS